MWSENTIFMTISSNRLLGLKKKRSKIIGLKLLFDASCDVLCAENVLFLVLKRLKCSFLTLVFSLMS